MKKTKTDKKLKKNKEEKSQKIDYKDKYVRLLAEYTNFAKQKEIEMQNTAKFGNKNILLKVLDILDDIDSGLKQEMVSEETKNILKILKIKIQQLLAYEGVLEMEIKVGDVFNPGNCEVVNTVEDKEMSGKIIEILRKGYTISDNVLRTAKVVVGK